MRSVFVRHRWEPYLWILPSILLMLVFVVFPIGIVFRLAFSSISRAGVVGEFAGLQNFRDAVSSPALEFKSEGFVLGTGAKMFLIAGPVIVYGLAASMIYGFIIWLFKLY